MSGLQRTNTAVHGCLRTTVDLTTACLNQGRAIARLESEQAEARWRISVTFRYASPNADSGAFTTTTSNICDLLFFAILINKLINHNILVAMKHKRLALVQQKLLDIVKHQRLVTLRWPQFKKG